MTLTPIDYYDGSEWEIADSHPVYQREVTAVQLILRHGPRVDGARLLDVGCGDGRFLKLMQESASSQWDLHGVDFSHFQLEKAESLPYSFQQCNLEAGIPHGDGKFEVVYSGEVVEHVYNPDHLVAECARVLKPHGLLVLSTPNLQAWYNRMLFPLGIQPLFYEVSTKSTHIGAGPLRRFKRSNIPVGHLRVFNRRGIVDLVENEGFRVIEVKGAVFPALPRVTQGIDNFFNRIPSLASILIVTARKIH